MNATKIFCPNISFESNIRPKVRWRILLVPGHFGILVNNLKSEILGSLNHQGFQFSFLSVSKVFKKCFLSFLKNVSKLFVVKTPT